MAMNAFSNMLQQVASTRHAGTSCNGVAAGAGVIQCECRTAVHKGVSAAVTPLEDTSGAPAADANSEHGAKWC